MYCLGNSYTTAQSPNQNGAFGKSLMTHLTTKSLVSLSLPRPAEAALPDLSDEAVPAFPELHVMA